MDCTLAEELLLIAHNDTTGRQEGGTAELGCGLAGAVLVELALAGRVDIVEERVRAIDTHPTGDPVLDTVLQRIATEKKPRKPDWWVGKLRSATQDRLLDRLVDQGVLSRQRSKVLGLFPVRRYPTLDAGVESAARARLQNVVVHGAQPDAHTGALAALLDACGLARRTFPDVDRKQLAARMKELSEGQWTSDAVRKAIRSIRAGVAAATTTVTTTTVVTST